MMMLSRRSGRSAMCGISKRSATRSFVVVSEEVKAARAEGRAIVALESTIISHGGMPYPKNLDLALELEEIIRKGGAVPATCAIIDGTPKVGLSAEDLEYLSTNTEVMKASRRDLPWAMAHARTASTTVSGTMVLAHKAGIEVFATGGIGGVHRGASESFDVSADLLELGMTPVTVVCAGVKSILDIPKTLEVLETQGVPVVTYKSTVFPAFFTADSGLKSPATIESAESCAKMILAGRDLGLQTGMVVAVPNDEPMEDQKLLADAVGRALLMAEEKGVKGSEITPYLLQTVKQLTNGASVRANIALVRNNTRVATDIAVHTAALRAQHNKSNQHNQRRGYCSSVSIRGSSTSSFSSGSNSDSSSSSRSFCSASLVGSNAPAVVVFGGAALDSISTLTHPTVLSASNPGCTRTSYGGVGRNVAVKIAEVLAREGEGGTGTKGTIGHGEVSLVSIVGADGAGKGLLQHLQEAKVDGSHVVVATSGVHGTARYTAVHATDGELIVAVADMQVLDTLTASDVFEKEPLVRSAKAVVLDANLSPAVVRALSGLTTAHAVPLFYEPTSDHKCALALGFTGGDSSTNSGGGMEVLRRIDVIKPNAAELCRLLWAVTKEGDGGLNMREKHTLKRALAELDGLGAYGASSDLDLEDLELLGSALHRMMAQCNDKEIGEGEEEEKGEKKSKDKHVLASLGSRGVLWISDGGVELVPALPVEVEGGNQFNTNGCGDALMAGVVAGSIRRGGVDVEVVREGVKEAYLHIMQSKSAQPRN